jgi:hypothetical protein
MTTISRIFPTDETWGDQHMAGCATEHYSFRITLWSLRVMQAEMCLSTHCLFYT